jgi:hypothetical protein
MNLVTLNIVPHTSQEHLHFRSQHPQRSRQQRHGKPLQPTQQILSIPQPQDLLSLPLGPRANRPRVLPLHHIHEARFFKILLVLPHSGPILADLRRSLHDEVDPSLERGAFHRIVHAHERDDAVLEFEVAAWTREVEGGFYHGHVRFEAGCEGAAVDVVEVVGEEPWVFCVVDFKVAVGWDTGLSAGLEMGKEIDWLYVQVWLDWA